jgi:hypothetical protein
VLANDTDPDGGSISIDAVTQPANGTVVITNGGADLTYQPNPGYCNDPPGTTPDTFTYTLTPGASTATVSVTVTCIDDPPTAVADTATVIEDSAATPIDVLANDTDPDAGPISITSVTQPANGVVVITGGGSGPTYQPNPDYCNNPPGTTPDTFSYTLTPGGSTASVSVTVTCVDDPPTAVADAATVVEDDPATTIDVLANDTDVDVGPIAVGSVTQPANGEVVITNGGADLSYLPDPNYCNDPPATTPDTFTYTLAPGTSTATVGVTVTCVVDDPTAVADSATIAEDSAATAIDVLANDSDFDGAGIAIDTVTQPANGTVVITGGGSGLTHQPDPNYCNSPPGTTLDTFAYTITPGGSTATVTVTVTCVDDPPAAVADAATVVEDAAATAVGVLANDTDVDAGPISITSVTQPANGTVVITGGGTGLTYQPNPNYCNSPPGTTLDTFTYTLTPGGSSATVTVTVTCVNDPPVAGDDSFTGTNAALANTRLVVGTTSSSPNLTISGSVLANDSDPDTPTGLTAGPATISSTNCAGCNNVTMEADGNFTYDPPAGFTGSDTFTYTVTDNDPEVPANQTDTATVTIEVVGPLVWYVDIDAAAPPAGQGGRSHSPFNSLAPLTTGGSADGLDGAGDIIFVGVDTAPATGPYEGGIVLETNQRLWGEPFGLNVDPVGPIPATQLVPAGTVGATNPNVRNSAVGGVGITLANGVDVQRVNAGVTNTASTTGIAGTAITTATVGPNMFVQGNATGVMLTGPAGGNITVAAGILANSTNAVNVADRNSGTVTFSGPVSGSATNAGVTLTNNTGATVAFSGQINLAGSGPATTNTTFTASGGGTITANAATNQISSFTGTGISLNGVTIGAAGILLNSLTSTLGGAANGILLTNVAGPGAFTVNSGTITATNRALDIDDNGANITIGATLTTSGAAARSVEVTNRDGGTVDINALVTDTSLGINLTTNGTGTIRFDGGLNANTGTNTAFNATGGGTIAVTDTNGTTAPNNTLTTTTGTALNFQNTNIHADDLTFLSISANGASNGIVLNATGAAGNLVVTGTGSTAQGGDNSGGTIQATSDHGISLTNTTSPSFRNMRLLNTGNSGINGTQVTGFSFVDGTITGAGDASDENSITFDDSLGTTPNLTGVVTITNNVISQTEAEAIDILNFAGTITSANVSNNALSDTGDVATPGSAISIIANGTPSTAGSITTATVANNTITDFRAGVGVQIRAGNVNAGGPAGHAGMPGTGNVIAVTGNLMNGGTGGIGNQPDRFFTGGASGIGQGNFNISNNGTAANRLRNIDCIAIEVQADGPVTMTSTVQNNFINANSAVGCAGIAVGTDDPSNLGAGTHTTLISGNNVMGTDGPGIFPIVRDSGSTMTARVINNTVAAPIATNAARAGIRVDSGSAEGDTTLCLEISGNTTAGSTNSGTATTSPGINLRKQGTDPAVNTFGIEGLSPSPTGTPNVENHVNGLNTSTSGTFGVNGTALLSAQTGFTSCVAP